MNGHVKSKQIIFSVVNNEASSNHVKHFFEKMLRKRAHDMLFWPSLLVLFIVILQDGFCMMFEQNLSDKFDLNDKLNASGTACSLNFIYNYCVELRWTHSLFICFDFSTI